MTQVLLLIGERKGAFIASTDPDRSNWGSAVKYLPAATPQAIGK
jgi:hypothetical protein